MFKIKHIIILTPLFAINIAAQSFGFGCLGLSGVYGGYSIQQFDVAGLENGIDFFCNADNMNHENINFSELEGLQTRCKYF